MGVVGVYLNRETSQFDLPGRREIPVYPVLGCFGSPHGAAQSWVLEPSLELGTNKNAHSSLLYRSRLVYEEYAQMILSHS